MHSFQFIVKVKCQAVIRWCLRNISQMPPTYLRRPAHQLDVMIEIVIRWLHLLEKHLEFIKILKHLFQIDLKNIRISLTISIFLKWTIQYSVVWGFKCVTCNNMHIIPRKHVFNVFYKFLEHLEGLLVVIEYRTYRDLWVVITNTVLQIKWTESDTVWTSPSHDIQHISVCLKMKNLLKMSHY